MENEELVQDETLEVQEDGENSENTPEEATDDRYESQKRRAEKAEREAKELKDRIAALEAGDTTPKKVEKKSSSDELSQLKQELAETKLIAKGFGNDEISIITKAAAELGISPLEASERKYVMAEIQDLREEKKIREATPGPSVKSGSSKKDVDYYIQKDEMPEDPEMIRAIIARKAGKTYKPLPKS